MLSLALCMNLDGQLHQIHDHHRNKPPAMPTKGCLDQVNWGGKILLNWAVPLHGLASWISGGKKKELRIQAPAFMALCFPVAVV